MKSSRPLALAFLLAIFPMAAFTLSSCTTTTTASDLNDTVRRAYGNSLILMYWYAGSGDRYDYFVTRYSNLGDGKHYRTLHELKDLPRFPHTSDRTKWIELEATPDGFKPNAPSPPSNPPFAQTAPARL